MKLPARSDSISKEIEARAINVKARVPSLSGGGSAAARATVRFKLKPKYCEAAFAAPAHANRASARPLSASFSSARQPPGKAASA